MKYLVFALLCLSSLLPLGCGDEPVVPETSCCMPNPSGDPDQYFYPPLSHGGVQYNLQIKYIRVVNNTDDVPVNFPDGPRGAAIFVDGQDCSNNYVAPGDTLITPRVFTGHACQLRFAPGEVGLTFFGPSPCIWVSGGAVRVDSLGVAFYDYEITGR